MKDLIGKVALITGASGGIGKAVALALADEGCDVVLCARREKELNEVADAIRKKGRRTLVVQTDVAVEEQMKDLAKKAFKDFKKVDIVFCNAGIGWTGPTHLMTKADWDTVYNVNFFHVIYAMQLFVPPMVERREGHFVINASAFGLTGIPFGTLYASSKSALIMLGECLRSELASSNVGVTTISPGLIESDLIANTTFKKVDEEARGLSAMVTPMPVEKCVQKIIKAIKKNKGLVVITALANALWYIKRLSQRFYELVSLMVANKTSKYVHNK
jgi:NADP-dependent 3-hydroxy acid dehydrogenase YdfG